MSQHGANSIGSHHGTTADALLYRGLEFIHLYERTYPRDLAVICHEFREVLTTECCRLPTPTAINRNNNAPLIFSNEQVTNLLETMTGMYRGGEMDFDKALFNAFRNCLAGFELDARGKNKIVLRNHNERYAVGFVRHAPSPRLDRIPTIISESTFTRGDPTTRTSAGLELSASQTEHAVCLLERCGDDNDCWKVTECFDFIKIKTNETNCAKFPTVRGIVDSVDLRSGHGALGQVLLDTMRSVVLSLARCGIWKECLPLAVIAGRKPRREDNQEDRLRWVSGSLYCPEVSGDPFSFSVDGYGQFHDQGSREDKDSANESMRLFLDTMLVGLKLAISVRNLRIRETILSPCPASGRCVQVGDQKLNVSFCASPIRGAATILNDSKQQPWSIHQADLFRGNVNLHEVLKQPDLNAVDFRSDSDEKGETTVLVKVSTTAVHSLLNTPADTLDALKVVKDGEEKMLEEIRMVLHAAIQTPVGLITIMLDLSHEYDALRPESHANRLPVLWAGFATLVKNILLPMAEKGVIHPDIRPGFDVTFNILCKMEADHSATLKLIDLESLVHVVKWNVPIVKGEPDRRFIRRYHGWKAFRYVWWQCVFVAYVWSEKIKASDVAGVDVNHSVINVLREVLVRQAIDRPAWLVALRDVANDDIVDAASVYRTLTDLGQLFNQ